MYDPQNRMFIKNTKYNFYEWATLYNDDLQRIYSMLLRRFKKHNMFDLVDYNKFELFVYNNSSKYVEKY